MQTMPKHIFWPIIDSSSLYTRGQGSVIRRIGGRGNFRSRDENCGQTIRSAIPENPMLYAKFLALSSTEPELLPIEVLHCGNSVFGSCKFIKFLYFLII